jgi:hypothetical protein
VGRGRFLASSSAKTSASGLPAASGARRSGTAGSGLRHARLVHVPIAPDQLGVAGVEARPLEELLAETDFLTLHVPLTPATRHLVGDDAFARLKPGARLVNVSRGGVVDEAALLRAIEAGRVAGAALDVFEQEPPAEGNPLVARAEVIATPHLGASTREAQELVALTVAEQVLDYLRGRPARNAVNLPSLSPEMGERVRPFLALAERLGAMQAQLAAAAAAVHVRFAGEVADFGPTSSPGSQGPLAPGLAPQLRELPGI